jgi:hypothetical protein
MKTPDWDFWLNMPDVELWQAVMLSMNIDPDQFDTGYGQHQQFISENEIASKRLRLLEANRWRIHFRGIDRFIPISKFSTWATSVMKWPDLPPELEKLAHHQDGQSGNAKSAKEDQEFDEQGRTDGGMNDEDRSDADLVKLFDAVTVPTLEKMFPARGKWADWAERAHRNGLITARDGRAMFNPYLAGVWFLGKGLEGWDLARCQRVLANNLPARSRGSEHLLTGGLE